MAVSATAQYSCELPGIAFQEREWAAIEGLQRATVAAREGRLQIVVTTDPAHDEEGAERTAVAAAEQIWWGLHQQLAVNIRYMTRPVRDSLSFAFVGESQDLAFGICETVRVSDACEALLTPGPLQFDAAALHRRPSESSSMDLYFASIAEHDPALQFQGLYNALAGMADTARACDCQVCIDGLILGLAPDSVLVAPPDLRGPRRCRRGRPSDMKLTNGETVYTSLRNRLGHANSPGRQAQGGWSATIDEIRQVLGTFRSIVVRSLFTIG